jgi:hypothetical protein
MIASTPNKNATGGADFPHGSVAPDGLQQRADSQFGATSPLPPDALSSKKRAPKSH